MTDTKHSAVERAGFEAAWPEIQKHGHERGWLGVGEAAWMARAAIAAAAPAGEPVAYCAPNAKGLPEFGKGWMFSPVPQLMATMPLYAAPVPAAAPTHQPLAENAAEKGNSSSKINDLVLAENSAAPKAALTDEKIDAIWQGLPGIAIHNKASRAGMDTQYALRIAFAKAIEAASGPNAALVTLLKEILDDGQAFMGAIELSSLDGVAWAERARAALAAAGVK